MGLDTGKGSTFQADPKWTHDCAKEILSELGVEYDVWKMYGIVRILKKYRENLIAMKKW